MYDPAFARTTGQLPPLDPTPREIDAILLDAYLAYVVGDAKLAYHKNEASSGPHCEYDDGKGNCCVVGRLLPEHVRKEVADDARSVFAEMFDLNDQYDVPDFWAEFQNVHDYCASLDMKGESWHEEFAARLETLHLTFGIA